MSLWAVKSIGESTIVKWKYACRYGEKLHNWNMLHRVQWSKSHQKEINEETKQQNGKVSNWKTRMSSGNDCLNEQWGGNWVSCWSLEQCLTHSRHSKFVKRGDSRRILVNKSSQVLYFNSANNQTQKEYGGYLHISHGTIVTVHSISCATAAFIYTLLLSLL